MADRCCTYTYAAVTVNGDPDTDTLVISDDEGDGIEGLDGQPVRRQIDPVSNDDGGISQPAHFGERTIKFTGRVHIGTQPEKNPHRDLAGYLGKLITLQKAIVAALEAQLNTATALAWTDSAGESHSIQAMYGVPGGEIAFGGTLEDPTFTFTLTTAEAP